MQYLRMTARPPLAESPRLLQLLIASEHVVRTEWISWNLTDSRGLTVLLHVVGDREVVQVHTSGAPEVVIADTAPAEEGAFFLLVTLDPSASPVTESIFEVVQHDGMVLLPPVTRQEGAIEVRMVGEPAAVSEAVEALPPAVDVNVHEVGERGLTDEHSGVPLSDRQRDAVVAALELGYYDQPRSATHEDIAEVLGCAPSTASEHVKKVEAKLVRAAVTHRR